MDSSIDNQEGPEEGGGVEATNINQHHKNQDPLQQRLLLPPSSSSPDLLSTSQQQQQGVLSYGSVEANQRQQPIITYGSAAARGSVRLVIAPRRHHHQQQRHHHQRSGGGDSDSEDQDDEEEEEFLFNAKQRLLEKASQFKLGYSPERGYRATEFQFFNWSRPHMRAMHMSWICFFASYYVQFAMAPLLPQIQSSLKLTKRDIWSTNVWMMIGGIPLRLGLGPLCDSYGPRYIICWVVALCSLACALSAVVVQNLVTLIVVRFMIGAMDAFVPCQCWITSQFVREVGGTIMAIAGGLGASGSAFTQLIGGYIYDGLPQSMDDDLAWRITLLFPATFGLIVAFLAYRYSDDCPLGNFVDVKRAGLMMERSAVDSFRSGVYNLNSWLLFLQFAGSCGVDVTMCNGCAIYYYHRFHQKIATAGAIAFLYGLSAIYARGLGGYISDKLDRHFSLLGRLWLQFGSMLLQGFMNIWFARTDDLQFSIIIMVMMSILIQVSWWANCQI